MLKRLMILGIFVLIMCAVVACSNEDVSQDKYSILKPADSASSNERGELSSNSKENITEEVQIDLQDKEKDLDKAIKKWNNNKVNNNNIYEVLSNVSGLFVLNSDNIKEITVSPTMDELAKAYIDSDLTGDIEKDYDKFSKFEVSLNIKLDKDIELSSFSRNISFTMAAYSKVLFENPKVKVVSMKLYQEDMDEIGKVNQMNVMKVDWSESVYKSIDFDNFEALLLEDYTVSYKVASDLWINAAFRYHVPELYVLIKDDI